MESAEKVGTRPDLSHESDSDLLVYMTMREDDALVADEAWAELYRRHAKYVLGVCQRACQGILSDGSAEELTHDTLLRAYERASTFNADGVPEPERQRFLVRAWLGRIAQNILNDRLRGLSGAIVINLDADEWATITDDHDQGCSSHSLRIKLIGECLEALAEREKHVLRITMQHFKPKEPHQRLPNEVSEDLARALQTTPENIRQLRRRAMRKVKECVESKS
jgi:RNA polymerase sigma-70 factor, ECF subfamily